MSRVNERGVLSYEFYLVLSRFYFEVGNVGGARDVDVLEHSAVFSFGRQYAGDAAVDAQVRMIECVFTRERSFAGIAFDPDAELAASCDLAWRFGIVKLQVIIYRVIPLKIVQNALLHFEA